MSYDWEGKVFGFGDVSECQRFRNSVSISPIFLGFESFCVRWAVIDGQKVFDEGVRYEC